VQIDFDAPHEMSSMACTPSFVIIKNFIFFNDVSAENYVEMLMSKKSEYKNTRTPPTENQL